MDIDEKEELKKEIEQLKNALKNAESKINFLEGQVSVYKEYFMKGPTL